VKENDGGGDLPPVITSSLFAVDALAGGTPDDRRGNEDPVRHDAVLGVSYSYQGTPYVIQCPIEHGTGENGKGGEDPAFSTPFLLIRNV